MPLFGKKAATPEPASDQGAPSALSADAILNLLEYEVARSRRYGRPLSILRVIPQTIAAEVADDHEIAVVSEATRHQLRDVDHLGILDDQTLVAILPETNAPAARVVAHRLSGDLTLRSSGGRQRNWLVGSSTLWEGGETADSLVTAAQSAAASRGT